MSYILDALKKSERERPPGTVPDLFTVQGPQSQPVSPRWPARAIVAVALLLAVPAILLWVWIGTGRHDDGAARPPIAASPQPRPEEPIAPAPPRTAAAPAPTPAHAVAVARRSPGTRSQAAAPIAQKSREASASAMVQRAVVVAPTPTQAEVEAPLAQVPVPAPVPVPAQVPSAPAAEETPPADMRVLDLDELPAPIRTELPKLLVSGHVWSEEPSLRLLSVDDRLLHEGSEAGPGVSLQEITPTGAVFVFKGWHFRVAGGRP